MAKKCQKKMATTSSEVRDREYCAGMVNTGEVLGDELIDLLSQHGDSFEGLLIETYALCKVWAAVKAVSDEMGFDFDDLTQRLLPSFIKEMKNAVSM
jgi:hypothetical protein